MTDTFSTYEAKARFSELLRRVREGRVVTVTYHGEPVAEIRPVDRHGGTAARVEWLRSRGVLAPPDEREGRITPIRSRPGALDRFIEERNR